VKRTVLIGVLVLVLGGVAILLLTPGSRAQVSITIEPAMTKGTAAAKVTIVEFSDFQCPFCKRVVPTLNQVMKEYEGRVRLVFKDMPLEFHELARPAHEASRCAAEAGKFWSYHDRLFEEQPAFERADLVRYAVEAGIDRAGFVKCLDERRFAAAVEADVAQARSLAINGTPTFLINGRPLVGAQPVEAFRSAIDDALSGP
jgi:protein-disulfide isomerase